MQTKLIDPLTLQIPKSPDKIVMGTDSDLPITVSYDDGPKISIGNNVRFGSGKDLFPVNAINIYPDRVDLITATRTKTSFLLLPVLPGHRRDYLWETRLVNTFLNLQEERPCIELLYRFSGSREFAKFEALLRQSPYYVTSLEPSPTSTLYRFFVPTQYLNDVCLFLNGAYSKLSDGLKKSILRFHGQGPDDPLSQILYLSEERRARLERDLGCRLPSGAELYSIPELSRETYDPKIYRI